MMYKIIIKGVVQGVGFRPYIFRKAKEHGIRGSVRNVGSGVEIISDDPAFAEKLTDLPPLAKIHDVLVEHVKTDTPEGFLILKSTVTDGATDLPADIFMCDECLKDMRDKKDRRFGYYFVTCTNCGPRFSIIEDYPYDRPYTSMKHFMMCPDCKKEYLDPDDRRYHAQTIACPSCGPRLILLKDGKAISAKDDASTVRKTIEILKKDCVAIKGVGGFHICSGLEMVGAVRKLLNRPDKPFAIMVRDIEMLSCLAEVSKTERELLESPQRPIVVLKKKGCFLDSISELDTVGVMLPYTALHYLIFDQYDSPLLMTSCNMPGDPVMTSIGIAQYQLTHEREIVNRCDDSVIKVIDGRVFFLRRSRGYVPGSIKLLSKKKDTIALGAQLNNALCSVKSDRAYFSQYIGDTSRPKTQEFMQDALQRLMLLTRLKPVFVVCDLHPQYHTTSYAKKLAKDLDAKLVMVQHHKAHVASVAAEHGLDSYVGIAADGMGYGEDKTIWGGEVFDVEGKTFRRIGHLEPQPMIGGDSATINPKKMLFGILSRFMSKERLIRSGLFDKEEAELYLKMLLEGFNTSLSSSAGRVLDATAALIGICDKMTYEGRPAMLLESAATTPYDLKPVIKIISGRKVLMTTPLFEFLAAKKDKGRIAATAQMYLARGLYEIARGKKPIVFSGGVAYNRMISGYLMGRQVLFNKEIPCGDGGICLGQIHLLD